MTTTPENPGNPLVNRFLDFVRFAVNIIALPYMYLYILCNQEEERMYRENMEANNSLIANSKRSNVSDTPV